MFLVVLQKTQAAEALVDWLAKSDGAIATTMQPGFHTLIHTLTSGAWQAPCVKTLEEVSRNKDLQKISFQ